MTDKISPLKPDCTYHIYNRANGNEKLFIEPENYQFFLDKYKLHIHPIADTFCYCLMPNHFHFLIRIKSEEELLNLTTLPKFETLVKLDKVETLVKLDKDETLVKLNILEKFISKQFSNFFSSYSQSFNKQQDRKGNLFIHQFKRKKIENTQYLRKVVHYIHFNPIIANHCTTPGNYRYSSYQSLVSTSKTLLKRNEVISWFENLENFIYIHKNPPELSGIDFD